MWERKQKKMKRNQMIRMSQKEGEIEENKQLKVFQIKKGV